MLGIFNPLPLNLFDAAPRFLGVRVGSDAEMIPRQELTSVPSTFRAQSVVSGGTGGGITRINQGRKIIVDNPTGPTPTINVAPNSIDDDDIRDNSLSGGSIATDAVGSDELQARVTFTPNGSVEIGDNSNQLRAHLSINNDGGGQLLIDSFNGTPEVTKVTTNVGGGGSITVKTDDGGDGVFLSQTNTGSSGTGLIRVHAANGVQVARIATLTTSTSQFGDITVREDQTGNTRVQMSLNTALGGAIVSRTTDGGQALLISTAGGNASGQAGLFRVFRPDGITPEFEVDGSGVITPSGVITSSPISLRMEHPLDSSKEIRYATLEGPESGLYVRGTAQLVNGQARIKLPDHFAMVAQNEGLTVSLTPLSANSEGLAVIAKSTREIVIRELRNGAGTYEFDYIVHGIRGGEEKFQVIHNKADFLKNVAMPPVEEAPAQDVETVASESNPRQNSKPPRN